MAERLLISKCRIKQFLRQHQVRVTSDFYMAMNNELKDILTKIAKRTKNNRRSTVLPSDI